MADDGAAGRDDAPSKLYIVNGARDSAPRPGVVHIDHPTGTKPATHDEVQKFISDHGLKLGDVVRFGKHRDGDTVIIGQAAEGGYLHFVRNPDDSGAGYLTIPAEVLRGIRNGPAKYADVIGANMPTINLHLSADDNFIVDTLGGRPPEGTQFDVLYIAGALETICVKPPESRRWHEFEPSELSLERVTRLLSNRESGDDAKLTLRVSLRGDQFTRYKDVHGRSARRHAWLEAVPELPDTWSIEKGISSGGSMSASWVWKLHGPARELEEVKRIVGEFLQGFDFEYVDDS